MSQEQLDAVKEQLLSEENEALKQSVYSAYLEEPERGADMIIAFAADKGLKLDATSAEVVDYLDNLVDDDIDIEMTPEMLASVSGGNMTKDDIHRKGKPRFKSMTKGDIHPDYAGRLGFR